VLRTQIVHAHPLRYVVAVAEYLGFEAEPVYKRWWILDDIVNEL